MTFDNSENFWEIDDQAAFDSLALKTFKFQYENNDVYRSFCDLIHCHPTSVKFVKDIPHLPISLFKTKKVCCFEADQHNFSVPVPLRAWTPPYIITGSLMIIK